MGSHTIQPDGWAKGSMHLHQLEAGALRVRLRVLTEDGRHAIAEASLDYFLKSHEMDSVVTQAESWVEQSLLAHDKESRC